MSPPNQYGGEEMNTQEFFIHPKMRQHLNAGPVSAYIELYAARLLAQGYLREMVRRCISVIAAMGRWLERRRLTLDGIDERTLQHFLQYHNKYGRPYLSDDSSLRRFLALLRELGVAHPVPTIVVSPCEQLERDFEQYLSRQIGLLSTSIARYRPIVSQFLQERYDSDALHWSTLSAADVVAFVQRHAADHSPKSAQLMCSALRSLLRFLQYRGDITVNLAHAVPSVAQAKLRPALPRFLSAPQVRSVLKHCDRHRSIGKRDYAILLLLAQLGLRAKEVATLTLDDIHWPTGYLTISAKGGDSASMPLSVEVGEAIADYLQNARPHSASRRLFLRELAPHTGFASSLNVSQIATRAVIRAGVVAPCTGSHLFRRSLATQLLRAGASLTEIGQVLRHRHQDTTRLYAQVDLAALRTLAMPWPGGVR
jgi:site-specific recombinase XerD